VWMRCSHVNTCSLPSCHCCGPLAGEPVTGVLVTDPVAYTTLFVEQCQGAGIDCELLSTFRHPSSALAKPSAQKIVCLPTLDATLLI
jgi:hypothetical protein